MYMFTSKAHMVYLFFLLIFRELVKFLSNLITEFLLDQGTMYTFIKTQA